MNMAQLIQVCACLFMTGVIWIVQILVYPNFRLIENKGFQVFHQFHQNRITWVVAPMMIIEVASGIWIYYAQPSTIYLVNLISILLLWVLTAFVSVPIHHQLERNRYEKKDNLIWSNWLRTLIWTLRTLFWVFVVLRQSSGVS